MLIRRLLSWRGAARSFLAAVFELQFKLRSVLDPLGDADFVADRAAMCGGKARLAEGRCLHNQTEFLMMASSAPAGLSDFGPIASKQKGAPIPGQRATCAAAKTITDARIV